MGETIPTSEDLNSATKDMEEALSAFTIEEPQKKALMLGGEDPRDAGLEESVISEDVVFQGRIFNVKSMDRIGHGIL